MLWSTMSVYIDDILTFGKDFEGALKNLEQVLQHIQQYGE